ncbi:aminoglycoside phosphotransferase family protein [Legionella sp. CNM-4043-24]|uniref:aminoglycoside phosphotransferase family protein n=1 Tax=Legionella sp. CNM-4043-24 TaxID=3421646 RepID=UPI00403ADAD2
MAKMHENELEINEFLVKNLIEKQCPRWANLTMQPVSSSGTDNALFRLGDDYIVRLPRIEWAPGSIVRSINKEYEWIPKIAHLLTIPVSKPVFKGSPDDHYPWPWLIAKWYDGQNPDFENDNEYELLAKDLADFINNLHAIRLADGPFSRRGVPLKNLDQETRTALKALQKDMDTKPLTALWDNLSDTPQWDKESVWVHGDFLPGNIITQNNRLSAVIDFTDTGIGDPACDLIVAWSLFNAQSRSVFKDHLYSIDENTWQRGRGWALSIAVIMLPYYKNSNPVLATLARRMIHNVIQS